MSNSPVIRVFSDLHLGHPGCRIASVEQLRPLFAGADRIVFNGDTVEQHRRRLLERGKVWVAQLRCLLDELNIEAVFLTGNHDPKISSLHAVDLAGGKVFVFHGDALFRHLSPWSPKIRKVIPEIESIRAGFGEEKLARNLDAVLECTSRCRALSSGHEKEFRSGRLKHLRTAIRFAWPPHRPVNILSTWFTAAGAAHRFAERHRPESKIFLFGHTHWPGIWKRGERTVINTGGYVAMLPARVVEIRGDRLTCHRIDESPGRFQIGEELISIALSRPLKTTDQTA